MNIKSIGSKIKGNPTMVEGTVYSMLIICSISHFLNDMIQSIIPSIYPIVKDKFDFSFAQIGIITTRVHSFRCTDKDWKELKKLAKECGMSIGKYLVETGKKHLKAYQLRR